MTETPRRTQRQRVGESSRRLTEAAIALIAEQGYASTTAQQIGLRAGYSRDMVRVRFGTKENLLDTILSTKYESRLDVPAAPDESGLERVLARITRLREFAVNDPQLLRAMFILNFEAARVDGQLRTRIRRWIDHFQDGLADDIHVGQIDGTIVESVDAEDQAREILATAIGFAYAWIVDSRSDLVSELAGWSERVRGYLGCS